MAGEWLKFDCSLPEKPEVLAITIALGWDDPDLTVGKLMRLFRWFDQHTIDGNASSVTPSLLDRIVGVTGFVKAVADVGWVVHDEHGLSLQNFDRHNGATAKSRAQTAKRVANHKANALGNATGNADTNAPGVSDALPREEKRREEKEDTPLPPEGGKRRRKAPLSNIKNFGGFELLYGLYRRKVAKKRAMEAWAKIDPDEVLQAQMIAAVKAWPWPADKTKIPHLATWLNGRRWEDEDVAVAVAAVVHAMPGLHGITPTAIPWWLAAGFENPFEAANSDCRDWNFKEFRDGKRIDDQGAAA